MSDRYIIRTTGQTGPGVAAHLADTTDAHDASAISFSATGTISSTDVQAAIAELDSEKAAVAEPIAAAHISDTSDAHDASAISVLDAAGYYTGTTVETALQEVGADIADLASFPGAGVARFIRRARAGEDLAITCIGDSILEGQTVTTPATDGAMILLAADLSERFGVTVTQTNNADSGATSFRVHSGQQVRDAINDNADLYIVSAFDKNDIGADVEPLAPGYPSARSSAALERIIRTIRTNVPKADIIVMSTNPYVSGSSSNPKQQAKDLLSQQVAVAYGCEWVDCYAAFIALGDYSAYMYDSTHPNTLGHRLIADTILDHIPNTANLPTTPPPAMPSYGLYDPEDVNSVVGEYGYVVLAAPTTAAGFTYATTGAGWSSEATSTAGDYVEISGDSIELLLQVSTAAEDAAVVDLKIDGVTTRSNIALSSLGKQGAYWILLASGLTPGTNHTARLTLVSGTLRTYTAAGLMSGTPAFPPAIELQTITLSTGSIDTGGSYTNQASTTVYMPSGWTEAVVEILGQAINRVTATTTTERHFNNAVVFGGSTVINNTDIIPATSVEMRRVVPMVFATTMTSDSTITVRTRLLSTDKTNCLSAGGTMVVKLTRVA